MKQFILLATALTVLTACGGGGVETINWPEDLEGKRSLLRQKQTEMDALSKDVERLEREIVTLAPPNERPKRLVTTTQLKPKDFKHYVEIQATVQSDDFVSASAEVPGRLLQVAVREGENVNKGQLIARLDMEQVNKQIAEIEKALELARDVYQRQDKLWKQNIGSEIQYLQAKNNVERLEKSLDAVRFQLGKSKVYAPLAGVVEKVMLKEGEMASPGYPIVQILNTSKVKVVAEVPENYLTSVKKGESVTIKFPALGTQLQSRVSLIGKTINPANRTFGVEVEMTNSQGLLKPNLLALMVINDYSKQNAVVVPMDIVQQEASGASFIFVKETGSEGAFAKKMMVKTGNSYEGEIEITEGLKGTEEIILEGARNLSENEPLEVKTPDAKG
jgi:RND family efflux transporter MFP subunit